MTSGFLIVEGAVGTVKAIAQGSVAITGRVRKVLGFKLPVTLEADLNRVIQVKQIALGKLNTPANNTSSKNVINLKLNVPAEVRDSAERGEAQKYLLNVLWKRNAIVQTLEGAGFERAMIPLAQRYKIILKQIRNGYASEVGELKKLGDKLLARGVSPKWVAKTMHEKRRVIGKKYKDLTPEELRPFIYGRNEYGDNLGPTFRNLV